jgi:hypothetical protein
MTVANSFVSYKITKLFIHEGKNRTLKMLPTPFTLFSQINCFFLPSSHAAGKSSKVGADCALLAVHIVGVESCC